MKTIVVNARVVIPIEDIVDAVGPEVSRTLISGGAQARVKTRSPAESLRRAAERVISALDQLDIVTNTVGEGLARQALMQRVRDLRATHAKLRSK